MTWAGFHQFSRGTQIEIVVLYGLIVLLALVVLYLKPPSILRWSWRWCQTQLRVRQTRAFSDADRNVETVSDARQRQILSAWSRTPIRGPYGIVPQREKRTIEIERVF